MKVDDHPSATSINCKSEAIKCRIMYHDSQKRSYWKFNFERALNTGDIEGVEIDAHDVPLKMGTDYNTKLMVAGLGENEDISYHSEGILRLAESTNSKA